MMMGLSALLALTALITTPRLELNAPKLEAKLGEPFTIEILFHDWPEDPKSLSLPPVLSPLQVLQSEWVSENPPRFRVTAAILGLEPVVLDRVTLPATVDGKSVLITAPSLTLTPILSNPDPATLPKEGAPVRIPLKPWPYIGVGIAIFLLLAMVAILLAILVHRRNRREPLAAPMDPWTELDRALSLLESPSLPEREFAFQLTTLFKRYLSVKSGLPISEWTTSELKSRRSVVESKLKISTSEFNDLLGVVETMDWVKFSESGTLTHSRAEILRRARALGRVVDSRLVVEESACVV